MNDLPQSVQILVCRGYLHKETPCVISPDERREFEYRRRLARRWRNLIGELKYDLPRDMWQFVNMSMPKEWHMQRKTHKIKCHDFIIQIPDFLPIIMTYKRHELGAFDCADWQFHKFEITSPGGSPIASTKYEDFSLFLAVAHELGGKKIRNKVDIEEIQFGGDLADNAKTVKASLPRLTMEDFVGPIYDGHKKHEFYDPYHDGSYSGA